jgi:hypothetical protein
MAARGSKAFEFEKEKDWTYAVGMVETVAWLAGNPNYLDDLRETVKTLKLFEREGRARSATVFEWLAATTSYQGISDAVARTFMAEHGRPRWRAIAHGVKVASCPLLTSYWQFHGCNYRKSAFSCARQDLIETCPLPSHRFRNGNLNQLAYSLYLFIRDVAGGDLIGWIDARLAEADTGSADDRMSCMADAIIGPLSGVHSLSNKVLGMALADLLVVGNNRNPRWGEVGGALIAIDTLVHNFLVRTGILARARARHNYGPQCYGPNGCAAVLTALSRSIDARQFNDEFPAFFPRYIQKAIWAYCAAEMHNVCNGKTIRDAKACANRDCRLFPRCDRIGLRERHIKIA